VKSETPEAPAILRGGARILSKLAVCGRCHTCWPVAHVNPETDVLVPHEHGQLLHLWLERHMFCESVRFCAADQSSGALYDPMAPNGEPSRILEELRQEFERRRTQRG